MFCEISCNESHFQILTIAASLFNNELLQDAMNGIESLTPPSTDHTDLSDAVNIKDDPTWKDGDFVIVSSDGWRFRVPSHPLLSHRWEYKVWDRG